MILIYIIAAVLLVATLIWLARNIEDPVARAGRRGEEVAEDIIRTVLRDDDVLLTNVKISFEGQRAEVDNIIVNTNGVFLIEVKNYVGELVGDIDDFEWKKYKTTPGGDVYVKPVKNPIKQVNRQVYIVSNILRDRGVNVWVSGYVMLMENNSPVYDESVLRSRRDIDKAIHYAANEKLTKKEQARILKALGF